MKTRVMTLMALMSALLCVLGPLTIVVPISPVPVSLATLAIYFAVYILGAKRSVISCLLYLLMGMIGLPIFSGFSGGIGKLLGPTGGYLVGYIILAYVSGIFIEKWQKSYWMQGIGMILGTGLCYMLGTGWLIFQSQITFKVALGMGVFPFIIGDCMKIAIALMIGPILKKRMIRAGLVVFHNNKEK